MISRGEDHPSTISTSHSFKLRKASNKNQKRRNQQTKSSHYSRVGMKNHLLNQRGEQVINVRRSLTTEKENNQRLQPWQLNGESSKHALLRQKVEQEERERERERNGNGNGVEIGREGKRRNARIDLSGATQDHIDSLWKGLPKSFTDRSSNLLKKGKKVVDDSNANGRNSTKHHHPHHLRKSSSTPPSHHATSSSPLSKSKQSHDENKHLSKRQVEEKSVKPSPSSIKSSSSNRKEVNFQILPSSVLVIHSFDAAASRPTASHSENGNENRNENGDLWSSIAPISSWGSMPIHSQASILNGARYEAAAMISSQTTILPSSFASNSASPSSSSILPTNPVARASLDSQSSSAISTSIPTSSSSSISDSSNSNPDHFSLPHNTPILIFIVIGSLIVAVTLLAGLAWACRWSGSSKASKDKRRKRMKSNPWSPSGNSSLFEVSTDEKLNVLGNKGGFISPLPELSHRSTLKSSANESQSSLDHHNQNLNQVAYSEAVQNGNGWTLFDRPVPKSKSMSSLSREASSVDSESKNVVGGKGGNYLLQDQEVLVDQDLDVEQSIWPPPARRPSFIERLMVSRPKSTSLPTQEHEPPTVTGFSNSNLTRSNTTMTQSQLSHSISMGRSRSNGSNLRSISSNETSQTNTTTFNMRKSLVIENSTNVGDFRKGPYPTIRPLPGYGIDTPLFTHPFSPSTKLNPVEVSSKGFNKKSSNLANEISNGNGGGGVFSSLSIFKSKNKNNKMINYESDFEGTIGGKDKDLPKAKRLGKGVDRFTFEESTTEEELSSPFQGGRRSSIIEMGQDFDPSTPLNPPLAAHVNGLGRFGTPRTPGLAGVGAARLWEEMEIQNQMLAQPNAPFGSGPIHQGGNGNGHQSIDFDNREMLSPLATAIIPGQNGSFQPNPNSSYPPISASHQMVESNYMPSNLQVFETLRARQALIESKDSKLSMLPGTSNDYPNHPRTKLNEKIAKWWANSSIEISQGTGDEEIEILSDGLTPLPKTLEKKSNRQRKEVQRFKDEEEMDKIPKLRRIKSDVQSEISEVTSISAVQVDGNLKNPYLGKDVSIITPILLQQQQQLESENELVNSYYQLAHDQEEEKLDSDSFSDEKNATIYFGELPQLDTSEEEIESPKKRKEKSASSSSKKSSRESRRSSKATTRTETSLPPSYKTEGSSSGDEEEEEQGFRSQSRARTTRSSTTRSTASSTSVQTSLFDDAQVHPHGAKKRSSNVDIAERAQLANQQWGVGVGEKTLRSLEKIERKSKKLENRREQRRRSRELNIKAARDMTLGEADQLDAAELQSRRHTVLDMSEDFQSNSEIVKPIRANSTTSSIYSSITAPSEYCAPLFSKKRTPTSSTKNLSLPTSIKQNKRRSISQALPITSVDILSSPDSPWTSSDSEISVRRWSSSNPTSTFPRRDFIVQKKLKVESIDDSFEDELKVHVTKPLRIVSASNAQRKKVHKRSK